MKWQEDLTQDIRLHDGNDDGDLPPHGSGGWPHVGWKTNSDANQEALLNKFLAIKDKCRAILEIGVSREGPDAFTNIFLKNKKPDTIYVGIDTEYKGHLNNPQEKVFTIQDSSSNFDNCLAKIKSFGVEEFDFIFIDGWHSINQILADWEYTRLLSNYGIVGLHDTQYHPGPVRLVKYLDQNKWDVSESQVINNPRDWGIGFVWLKSN